MKYVGVKHRPEQTEIYWFEVPSDLSKSICVGSEVLCNTRKGNNTGIVVKELNGINQEEAKRIIGDYFPLKRIIAVSVDFELQKIYPTWEMDSSSPSPDKLFTRIKEWYDTGRFGTAILFRTDGELVDGYTAFLVARMFGHDTLHGFCVAEE